MEHSHERQNQYHRAGRAGPPCGGSYRRYRARVAGVRQCEKVALPLGSRLRESSPLREVCTRVSARSQPTPLSGRMQTIMQGTSHCDFRYRLKQTERGLTRKTACQETTVKCLTAAEARRFEAGGGVGMPRRGGPLRGMRLTTRNQLAFASCMRPVLS